jgi:3'-5' exoribonuclease
MEHKIKKGSYILMVLSDKSGEINSVFWNYEPEITGYLKSGDFLKVRGITVIHNTRVQLRVDKLTKIDESDVEVEDFIPQGTVDPDLLEQEIRDLLDTLKDEDHKKLASLFFDDPEFMKKFKIAPAAMNWHHSYAGGLMEHSLNVARICEYIQKIYPIAVRDTLILGALLHDIGKIHELSSGPAFEYTDPGRLIGHISMGYSMFETAVSKMDEIPRDLKFKISHIILSHHGVPEFGSPKRPKTMEAMIVRCADDLDAQTAGFSKVISEGLNTELNWSEPIGVLQRPVYLK